MDALHPPLFHVCWIFFYPDPERIRPMLNDDAGAPMQAGEAQRKCASESRQRRLTAPAFLYVTTRFLVVVGRARRREFDIGFAAAKFIHGRRIPVKLSR